MKWWKNILTSKFHYDKHLYILSYILHNLGRILVNIRRHISVSNVNVHYKAIWGRSSIYLTITQPEQSIIHRTWIWSWCFDQTTWTITTNQCCSPKVRQVRFEHCLPYQWSYHVLNIYILSYIMNRTRKDYCHCYSPSSRTTVSICFRLWQWQWQNHMVFLVID